MTEIGFTGTRLGCTDAQRATLRQEIGRAWSLESRFHSGDCVGADVEAHQMAWLLGYTAVLHPPTDTRLRAWVERSEFWDPDVDVLLPEKPYLERNLDIVKAADLLIVIPDGPYRIRSGTWWTFSAAIREGVPTVVIRPDGAVERAGAGR